MAPPGWYPDATNPSFLRWWDGQAWTPRTQPTPAVVAPAPARPPPLPGTELERRIKAGEARLASLQKELDSVEESLEIQSFGFYRPRYGFSSSKEYVSSLERIRTHQKELIQAGGATVCRTEWKVGGSVVEGRKMVKQLAKLMLRAFNGECDAAIVKTRYDNAVALETRLVKSHREINKLGESNDVSIADVYLQAKISELHLVHEHREKMQAEKDEQKRIREELREEEKACDEIAKAQAKAEAEEEEHERALAKVKAELAEATGKQHDKLEALVLRLETELKDVLDRKAKAIARAQLTRSGHVYVLSNVGSFGEGIYKIGLTRRLDPHERVEELGDASVPFGFDVHAIIYSPDAPALEHALHMEFAGRKINRVNHRKEYFRVSLEEIREAVEKHHGLITFVLTPEAEEWRKTRSMMEAETSSVAN